MRAIDIHAHIFQCVHGKNNCGDVKSEQYGRIENGGERKPFMPPLSKDTSFSAEQLLETMHRSNVERAVLVQNPTIGLINEEIRDAVIKYPDKFTGVVQVDPFKPDSCNELKCLLTDHTEFTALKLELSDDWGWLSIHKDKEFQFIQLYPLLEIVEQHKLHVIFDTGATTGTAYQVNEYAKLLKRFNSTQFIFEHLGYMTPSGCKESWMQLLRQGKRDNVSFGISAVGQLLEEEYPCKKALNLIKQAYDILGAKKLLWGTDCPTTLNRYTYQQMKDMIERHAVFLSESEKEDILYHNARTLFA